MQTKPMTIIAILFALALLSASCASTRPYIANESQAALDLQPTPYHDFSYVRLYPEDGKLVLYGKVTHRHGWCEKEPHVDLSIIGPDNQVARKTSLPIANRGGKRHGWYGAAFRVKLPEAPAKGQNVRLAFHETGCSKSENFDCGGDAAVDPQEKPDDSEELGYRSVPRLFPGSWR